MNVEIGAEAALFPEKEYINRIAVAVHAPDISYRGRRRRIQGKTTLDIIYRNAL